MRTKTNTQSQRITSNTSPRKPVDLTPQEAKKQTKHAIKKMERVRNIMSKYLTSKLTNHESRRSWLVSTLVMMIGENPIPMVKCNLKFEILDTAIAHNDKVFEQNGFDYKKVVDTNSATIITPGI